MTTAAPSSQVSATPARPARRRARFGGLLVAEWTKIRSVRSTVWTLIMFVVLTVGLTAGLTALVVGSWNRPGPGNGHVQIIEDPVGFILGPAWASASSPSAFWARC